MPQVHCFLLMCCDLEVILFLLVLSNAKNTSAAPRSRLFSGDTLCLPMVLFFPSCICAVMVLPFWIGHMIRCPWRAHYLTTVLQQQRAHPCSIKRIFTQPWRARMAFSTNNLPRKTTVNMAINLKNPNTR